MARYWDESAARGKGLIKSPMSGNTRIHEAGNDQTKKKKTGLVKRSTCTFSVKYTLMGENG